MRQTGKFTAITATNKTHHRLCSIDAVGMRVVGNSVPMKSVHSGQTLPLGVSSMGDCGITSGKVTHLGGSDALATAKVQSC